MSARALKRYMEHLLSAQPFNIKVETSLLGCTFIQPFPVINNDYVTTTCYLTDTDDGQFILKALESRIEDLKKEFDSL